MSINKVTYDNLDDWLDYHAPTELQITLLNAVRQQTKLLAKSIINNCPDSADRSYALRLLKLTLMTANQSIILGPISNDNT